MSEKILVINPGSTSTKLAVYDGENEYLSKTLRHTAEEIGQFERIIDQYEFRKAIIEGFLKESNLEISDFIAVIGRGGLVRPIPGGVYRVDEKMLEDLKSDKRGEHASNLGAVLAYELTKGTSIPSFIADPVVVDEMCELARYSGHPMIQRRSVFHALNQKAVALKAAEEIGKPYEDINLIVVHMGGGISVGAHKKGKVIDVNNALDGDGPFTPERTGTLPITGLIDLCYSGKYTLQEMKKNLKGNGGLVSYLGINDGVEIQKKIRNGDKEAATVYRAMIYQIVKWIGKMAAVLKGEIDGIILTGGLAYDQDHVVKWISESVSYLGKLFVYPGGDEEEALALAALRAVKGVVKTKIYSEEIL
ncbi:MAG TPA: butyrate kinase [Thermotogota bacterium]|nr:butyrate kinase [Thermotogota bacterium]HPJ87988.1 butyrate kinase [Thermotogota bacterium]HPR95075.1 butyrate kinase [Thermotogota bacterium]